MSMDIHAQAGHKVVYVHPHNGMPKDQQAADKYLVLHSEYTVRFTTPGESRTGVRLAEVEGIMFNSVMFDDVKQK